MTNFFLISFFTSLVVIVGIIANKLREIETGAGYVSWSPNADEIIRKQIFICRKMITEFPRHFFRESFHFLIQKIYLLAREIRNLIYPKIAHIVDTVKGKSVPKNKGGASFFLVNVQEHKDSLKK